MTITFRIENGTGTLPPKAAIVTPDQLASLRDLLAEQAVRLGMTMLLPIHGVTGDPGFELEARICPLALAVVSKCFDHDPDVIAVQEEAQFLGRRVRIWQALRSRDFRIRLSLTPDAAPQLAMSEAHAMTLLHGLGLDRARTGVIAMTELRDRLTSPRISRRLAADPAMASYVETLTEMAVMKPVEGEYRLAWI